MNKFGLIVKFADKNVKKWKSESLEERIKEELLEEDGKVSAFCTEKIKRFLKSERSFLAVEIEKGSYLKNCEKREFFLRFLLRECGVKQKVSPIT